MSMLEAINASILTTLVPLPVWVCVVEGEPPAPMENPVSAPEKPVTRISWAEDGNR